MEETQQHILETEEQIQTIEMRLNELALDVYDGLSDHERFNIRQSRNLDSVNGIEAKYWRTLIEQAEATP